MRNFSTQAETKICLQVCTRSKKQRKQCKDEMPAARRKAMRRDMPISAEDQSVRRRRACAPCALPVQDSDSEDRRSSWLSSFTCLACSIEALAHLARSLYKTATAKTEEAVGTKSCNNYNCNCIGWDFHFHRAQLSLVAPLL